MSKNIVVCCDGTGNSFGGDDNSNVVKLYQSLIIDSAQAGYYHPGVGTMGDPTARTRVAKKWSQLKGLAFGAGFIANVSDAYRFLMDTYEDGDDVFLFGFSRGSYTARALAGVLLMYGLLQRGNNGLIPYVTSMFAGKSRSAGGFQETFKVADDFKNTFSRDCPLKFVGLWDTVSSVGWVWSPVVLPFTGRNPIIKNGRHAVSIHERRCFYRQNLWGDPFPGQSIRQVWFTGVHSDIGGSYPESQSQLAKVTLEWMLVQAEAAGVKIDRCKANTVLGRSHPDDAHDYVKPDPEGRIHKSLNGAWWLLEVLPHRSYDFKAKKTRWRIPLGAYRRIPPGSTIYEETLKPESRVAPVQLPTDHQVEPACRFPPCPHCVPALAAGNS